MKYKVFFATDDFNKLSFLLNENPKNSGGNTYSKLAESTPASSQNVADTGQGGFRPTSTTNVGTGDEFSDFNTGQSYSCLQQSVVWNDLTNPDYSYYCLPQNNSAQYLLILGYATTPPYNAIYSSTLVQNTATSTVFQYASFNSATGFFNPAGTNGLGYASSNYSTGGAANSLPNPPPAGSSAPSPQSAGNDTKMTTFCNTHASHGGGNTISPGGNINIDPTDLDPADDGNGDGGGDRGDDGGGDRGGGLNGDSFNTLLYNIGQLFGFGIPIGGGDEDGGTPNDEIGNINMGQDDGKGYT